MFTLKFETTSAAFKDDPARESARILNIVADNLERLSFTSGCAIDADGNEVGGYFLLEDDG